MIRIYSHRQLLLKKRERECVCASCSHKHTRCRLNVMLESINISAAATATQIQHNGVAPRRQRCCERKNIARKPILGRFPRYPSYLFWVRDSTPTLDWKYTARYFFLQRARIYPLLCAASSAYAQSRRLDPVLQFVQVKSFSVPGVIEAVTSCAVLSLKCITTPQHQQPDDTRARIFAGIQFIWHKI